MTTVELVDGVLPVVVEEGTAGERLTAARLQMQGQRVFESMRRPTTREEWEQRGRRQQHERMNTGAAKEYEREAAEKWAAGADARRTQRKRDHEYRLAQVYSSRYPDCPTPSLPYTEEERAEFRAWLDAFKARQQNEEN